MIKLLEVTYCNQILKETESILDDNYTQNSIEVINGIITNKPSTIELYTKLNSDDMATSLKSIEESHVTKKKLTAKYCFIFLYSKLHTYMRQFTVS